MFSLDWIQRMMEIEPGHGLLQSILLFMIWLQSKGLRDEIRALRKIFAEAQLAIGERFKNLEVRVTNLETKKGGL